LAGTGTESGSKKIAVFRECRDIYFGDSNRVLNKLKYLWRSDILLSNNLSDYLTDKIGQFPQSSPKKPIKY
jgi:hypothetical protein